MRPISRSKFTAALAKTIDSQDVAVVLQLIAQLLQLACL
jgi:hypothetical protein